MESYRSKSILILLLILSSQSLSAEPLSLKKALELVTQKSPEVGMAEADAQVADANVGLAYSEFWPRLNAIGAYRLSRTGVDSGSNGISSETIYNFSRTSSYDLALSANIFNSFGSLANVNSALAQRNAAFFLKSKAIETSRLNAIQTYFGAVAFAEQSNYLKELVSFLGEAAKKTNIAFKSQAISKKEQVAVNYLYKDTRLKYFESDSALKKNLRILADLVGRKEIKAQDLIDDIRIERRNVPKASEIYNRYRQVDPGIKARNEAIDSIEYRKKFVLAKDFPKVDLEGRYGDKGGYVGVGISVPIFSGFSSFAQRRSLSEQKAKQTIDKNRYESTVREDINRLVDAMTISSTNIVSLTDAIIDANAIWKLANRSYRMSASEATDWEGALKRLLAAEIDMIRNLLVYRVAEASLREIEAAKE